MMAIILIILIVVFYLVGFALHQEEKEKEKLTNGNVQKDNPNQKYNSNNLSCNDKLNCHHYHSSEEETKIIESTNKEKNQRIPEDIKNGINKILDNKNTQQLIDLSMTIDEVANELMRFYGQTKLRSMILGKSLKWFIEKQVEFSYHGYFEQMEKNAVYFREKINTHNYKCALYLSSGHPILQSNEEINAFLNEDVNSAIEATALHLQFIRSGCNGCKIHSQHSRYTVYQQMRHEDIKKYTEELEFGYICYQSLNLSTQFFLHTIFNNHQLAGQFQQYTMNDIVDTIEEKIWGWTKVWIGLTKFGTILDVVDPIYKSKWFEIWEDDYSNAQKEMDISSSDFIKMRIFS